MRTVICLLAVIIAVSVIGCPARSLFPLFTDNDAVFNPALTGTWVDEGKSETFVFQKGENKAYNVVSLDKKGSVETYSVRLGQLGAYWFLDSTPLEQSRTYHVIPSHVFSRIWLKGDTLRMANLEGDWLREMINGKKLTISHVQKDDDIILTASTQELRDLLLRFAEDAKAFPNPGVLIRMK